MINKITHSLYRNVINIPGWHTKKKIVIFESDDWGSIRMPSLEVFNKLKQSNLDLTTKDFLRYNKNDTLESTDDLVKLYELLDKYRDVNNKSAVFTAITVMANPDFEKIADNNYSEYYYELFPETLKKYHNGIDVFKVWIEGFEKGYLVPEFHGREHLNVANWMHALVNNHFQTKLAFNFGFWSFTPTDSNGCKYNFQAAYDSYNIENELIIHEEIIADGVRIFKNIFGFNPSLFVPPNGLISRKLENAVSNLGFNFMNYSYINNEPVNKGKYRNHISYQGKFTPSGLYHITRNCSFEPSFNHEKSVSNCISQISKAFFWGKPAIIGTHRVNYIGTLNESNRSNGLNFLEQLLKEILKRWPDVEFATTRDIATKYNYFRNE